MSVQGPTILITAGQFTAKLSESWLTIGFLQSVDRIFRFHLLNAWDLLAKSYWISPKDLHKIMQWQRIICGLVPADFGANYPMNCNTPLDPLLLLILTVNNNWRPLCRNALRLKGFFFLQKIGFCWPTGCLEVEFKPKWGKTWLRKLFSRSKGKIFIAEFDKVT